MMLKSVLKFVFDNIGNPLSSKKISDTMTSLGRKINSRTVEKYLEAFSESYIIYPAKRVFKITRKILYCGYWDEIYVIGL